VTAESTVPTAASRFLQVNSQLLGNLEHIPIYLAKPVEVFKSYRWANLRFDVIAGLTVAAVVLPQAMSFALIAHLPPEMGLYAVIVGAVVGGLWGSSRQMHTGPTNVNSVLLLSTLLPVAASGSPQFMVLAGLVAVMVGVVQFLMGLARLGVLVNFVSHSVVVGFSAGTGVMIGVAQLPHLFGLELPARVWWKQWWMWWSVCPRCTILRPLLGWALLWRSLP
jgi:SulP family sulfate permease